MRAMINPVAFFLSFRYLRAKRRTRFVSFISTISLAGIALGVSALIIILSVMNGFEGELRDRLVSMSAHGQLTGRNLQVDDWRSLHEDIVTELGVVAAAPYIEMEGMIRSGSILNAVFVNGIVPELESAVSGGSINFIEGDFDVLESGMKSIIVGRLLAINLGVRIGDGVILLVPKLNSDGNLEPVLERFIIRGVFESGLQDYDALRVLIHIDDVARLMSLGSSVSAVRFRASDVMTAPAIATSLQKRLGSAVRASDWTVENSSYLRAIRLEKMMMSLMLSLIIGVAAFNIIASLVMVVTDKTGDIAILRTLGMEPNDVVSVFFIQGAIIGWLGIVLGVIFGVVFAINVPTIVPWMEQFFHFKIMPGDIYYVTNIPSDIELYDVIVITISAFILTSLATLYPARRAAHVDPSIALRYE